MTTDAYFARRVPTAAGPYLRYVEFDVVRVYVPREAPMHRSRCLLGDCQWEGMSRLTPNMAIVEFDHHVTAAH